MHHHVDLVSHQSSYSDHRVKGLFDYPLQAPEMWESQAHKVVLEIAHITVTTGREEEFAVAYRNAKKHVHQSPGCLSMRMVRGVESPQTFYLLIEWESVEAHEVGFRQSERFAAWRAAIGDFFAVPPTVEHFDEVD